MISHIYNRYNINSRQEEKKHETIKNFLKTNEIIELPAKLMSDTIKYIRPKGSTVKNGIIYDSVQGFFAWKQGIL